jgi:NADPH-dependent 2,4-dienoyl-CoA reductase/sulfur reductase-like enzyme
VAATPGSWPGCAPGRSTRAWSRCWWSPTRTPNFSICGIRYHVSGEVTDWRALAHRSRADMEAAGLRLRLDTHAERIDHTARTVTVAGSDGRTDEIPYDRLIIGTGAEPIRPAIAGLDRLPRPEMAEALTTRGLGVTVVEQLPQVLSTVDPPLAALVADELARHDVEVNTGTTVTRLERTGGRLIVIGHPTDEPTTRFARTVDLVLVVGVRPDTALAGTAGVSLGAHGAIAVDRRMWTSVPDILAAGDCVHTHHRVLGCRRLPAAGHHRAQTGHRGRGERGWRPPRLRRVRGYPGGQGLRPRRRAHRAARTRSCGSCSCWSAWSLSD